MRIALTHNLRLSDSEEEAEFDTPETVNALASALERLGHRVERVEVSGPASRTVSRLEAYSPDLVFNTAEGRRGRFREAFYPALFDELGFPYTGSDAYALAVTLDKQLTKLILQQHGVLTPRWQFVEEVSQLKLIGFRFPLIVKPNFEGSSKGITQDSVIEDPAQIKDAVQKALAKYPAGVLVEEFIEGRDLTVPFLEGQAKERGGVLTPVEYVIDPVVAAKQRHAIYDYDLKTKAESAVSVRCPARVSAEVVEKAQKAAATAFEVLQCRDLGRIDFRVTSDNQVYFLEINALPSLEPGAGIYAAAGMEGLHFDGVLNAVVQSAATRYKLDLKDKEHRSRSKPARQKGPLRVGFAFNVKRVKPTGADADDSEAEYDSPKTLQAIREAIASHGHEVVDLEANSELPGKLATTSLDIVFNIAEGLKGRNRESQVPAMLELLDIPYTGSDPAALAIALDKGLAKKMVRQAGIHTPDFMLMTTGKERIPKELQRFPLIVKPVAEGSSKGVMPKSVVKSEAELREVAREIAERYQQPALVEEYISGREFTVGLLGERRPRILPPMEIVFTDKSDVTPVYSFEHKLDWTNRIKYEVPAKLDKEQLREMEKAARNIFTTLGCRDVARIDFRMDATGKIYFIECNPLPGLTPGWSDLCLISTAAGMDYRTLIGEIMSGAIRRYKERERERNKESRPERPERHEARIPAVPAALPVPAAPVAPPAPAEARTPDEA